MIKFTSCLLLISFPSLVLAEAAYEMRGYVSSKITGYTARTKENHGQRHYAQFEHLSLMSDNFSILNQARWSYSSLYQDLNNPPLLLQSEDTHDLYPGENYLKWKNDSWVFQAGYQEVSWGEAFGFNYADLINPKDQTLTGYAEASEAKLPLLLLNTKIFFAAGSLQFLYSPEPRFNKTLPVSLFTSSLVPNIQFQARKKLVTKIFEEHEYGGKLSLSFSGLDTAFFYFDHIDRNPYYSIESVTLSSVNLLERHGRIQSYGASIAKTLFDDFVFRSDIVLNQNKTINTLSTGVAGFTLLDEQTDELNLLFSVDTPTYSSFSGVFIYAQSGLNKLNAQALREKEEQFAIAKISYDFGEEKIFDVSYTHQISLSGHAIQAQLSWPVNDKLELRTGAETYWGEPRATLGRLKNISNIFFSLKNYFQF